MQYNLILCYITAANYNRLSLQKVTLFYSTSFR